MTKKVCSRCREELPIAEFHRGTGSGQRQNYCKTCMKAKARARLSRPEVAEANRQRAREWGRANRPRQAEGRRRHRSRHPEAQRLYTARLRARRAGVASTLTVQEWQEIVGRFEARCAYCPAPFETIDHVVPLTKGGANEASNVVPACKSCNSAKQDDLWEARL